MTQATLSPQQVRNYSALGYGIATLSISLSYMRELAQGAMQVVEPAAAPYAALLAVLALTLTGALAILRPRAMFAAAVTLILASFLVQSMPLAALARYATIPVAIAMLLYALVWAFARRGATE